MQIRPGAQGERVYSPEGVSCTLAAQTGGFGGKTGLYEVSPVSYTHLDVDKRQETRSAKPRPFLG